MRRIAWPSTHGDESADGAPATAGAAPGRRHARRASRRASLVRAHQEVQHCFRQRIVRPVKTSPSPRRIRRHRRSGASGSNASQCGAPAGGRQHADRQGRAATVTEDRAARSAKSGTEFDRCGAGTTAARRGTGRNGPAASRARTGRTARGGAGDAFPPPPAR